MRILFFTHYYPPEVNAPASRTFEHCVRWARAGHEVTVVTCVPNCPAGVVFSGYRNRLLPQVEVLEGVRVVRVWTYLSPNAGSVRRIVNFLSYLIAAVLATVRFPRPDVIIATSPQFFCGWAGVWAARIKRVPFVLEIRDIWPESICTVGAINNRIILRYLEWLERRMYRSATRIVTVGAGYRARIRQRLEPGGGNPLSRGGGDSSTSEIAAKTTGELERIVVVTNGVDLDQFVPQPPSDPFLNEQGLHGKFICSYVGTIGMAHGLEVVIEAARILIARGRDDIRFCLVGDGAERKRLQQRARDARVERLVVFAGLQPKARMPAVLASSNACLIHLRGCELFGSVLPSKLFETMAMGCPIILGVQGEARKIVSEAGAGLEMEPDSAESLVACVTRLADDPELLHRLGSAGRSYVEAFYNRDVLAARMLEVLERSVGSRHAASPSSLNDPAGEPSAARSRDSAVESVHAK